MSPAYNYAKTGIVSAPQQCVPGLPAYLLGSLNRIVAPTRMRITSVALASPTATVVGTVIEGQIPVVGQLVSISGAVPSYFNVTNATILSVSAPASPDVGVYTITFALTNSNILTTPSPGIAVAPQVEVGDALVAESSSAAALQSNVNPAQGRTVRFDVSFPILPGAATINAQYADLDIDTEYQLLGTVAVVLGGVVQGATANGPNSASAQFSGVTANFVRFSIPQSGLAGYASATIVGKVMV